jgi:hypothetical protein
MGAAKLDVEFMGRGHKADPNRSRPGLGGPSVPVSGKSAISLRNTTTPPEDEVVAKSLDWPSQLGQDGRPAAQRQQCLLRRSLDTNGPKASVVKRE